MNFFFSQDDMNWGRLKINCSSHLFAASCSSRMIRTNMLEINNFLDSLWQQGHDMAWHPFYRIWSGPMTWLEHGFIQHCPARVPWRETEGQGPHSQIMASRITWNTWTGRALWSKPFLPPRSLFMSPSVLKTETSNSGLLKWLLVCTSGNPVSSGLL